MKLRTAIKIMRRVEDVTLSSGLPGYRRNQINKARRICRRKELTDRRIPYIPSDDELFERSQIQCDIFAGLLLGGGLMGFDNSILENIPEEELEPFRKQYLEARAADEAEYESLKAKKK